MGLVELMRVLTVNAGSSSLKIRLLDHDDRVLVDQVLGPADVQGGHVASFLEVVRDVDAVGHRVVHSGRLDGPARRIDDATLTELTEAAALAPLHQAPALAGIRTVGEVLPTVAAVACFDTAFHHTLAPDATTYALPVEWRTRWGLQRCGFHGLSHAYAVRRAAELLGRRNDPTLRVVSCHLGAGASLCAARGGRSVDTTMGFTPLEGLVMATRAGSVDPGLVLWLVNHAGIAPDDLANALERRSGLLGLAGTADMREILDRRDADPACALAVAVYLHRLVREIAAMTAALDGLDVLAFTGGVGERAPDIRGAAAERLAYLGVAVDDDRNRMHRSGDSDITSPHARVRTFVVEAREDLEIARLTRALLTGT